MKYGVILFDSTHNAMRAENILLKSKNLPVRIISTPLAIKATCGFALRYDLDEEEKIFDIIKEKDLVFESIVHAQGKGLKITYQNIELK